MFIDKVRINISAGNGGNGCQSIHRDLFNRKGTPDGGDGGKGGDIFIVVDSNKQTLLDFYYRNVFKGNRGKHGTSSNKKGEDGKPSFIYVPPGTMVVNPENNQMLADLTEEGQTFLAAKGGIQGKGNHTRKDATEGKEGEQRQLYLQLKLIADIGLVGLPNAGKSSLIRKISNAKPQIANYPFTTKSPVLGVIKWKDYNSSVIADIPGLIEGAHSGRGLGHEFLRHIERTKIILHIVDLDPYNGRDPFEDYNVINKELEFHSEHLKKLPQIVVCNKLDLTDADKRLQDFKNKIKKRVIGVSAISGKGLELLLDRVYEKLKKEGIL